MSRLACVALGTVTMAVTGCGDADRAAVGTTKPADADLQRFVVRQADLPDGYKRFDRNDSSSKPAGCVDLGDPAADRVYDKRLAGLGFKGCAWAGFERSEMRAGELERSNEPSSEAVLLRDERAASAALAASRRRLRAALMSTGAELHSLAAPTLGDEAPRGLTHSFDIQGMGKITGFTYFWRRGSVVAWVDSSNILGDFDRRGTLTLARRLDRRIAG